MPVRRFLLFPLSRLSTDFGRSANGSRASLARKDLAWRRRSQGVQLLSRARRDPGTRADRSPWIHGWFAGWNGDWWVDSPADPLQHSLTTSSGLPPILNYGTAEMQQKLLPDILAGKKFISLAM